MHGLHCPGLPLLKQDVSLYLHFLFTAHALLLPKFQWVEVHHPLGSNPGFNYVGYVWHLWLLLLPLAVKRFLVEW
jgi:hypothetical protein